MLVIIVLKLILNYYHWLDNKAVNHSKEWIAMAVASLPAIYFFTKASALPWYFPAPISALMIAWFIWLLFDGLYNKIRGFNWWFTGSDDKDDAVTDNFLQSVALWQQKFIKVGGLALFVTLYILFK